MLKPALRPPMRAPLRSADSPREGVGGWQATLSSFKAFLAANNGADNPHSLAAMPSPPTITTGTTLSGLGASNLTQVFGALANPSSFRFTGGGALWVSTSRAFPSSSCVSGGNMTSAGAAGANSGCWKVGAVVNAQKVAILVTGSTAELYRFLVNGQYVSFTGTAVGTGGALTYVLLDFGSKASRLIEIEDGQSTDGRSAPRRFVSFSIDPADTLTAPPVAEYPVIVLGDSFTAPTGPTQAGDAWWSVAADYLGLKDRWNSGEGGTGYVNPSSTGIQYKLGDRIVADLDRMIAISPPKVVVVAIGYNDQGLSGIQAEAAGCFDIIRSKCPTALVFVTTGPWDKDSPSGPSANYTAAKNAIAAALAGRGGFYALDMQGVSYTKIGDAAHPNDAGHSTLGLAANTQVRALVAAA